MNLKFSAIAVFVIGYLSDAVKMFEPDTIPDNVKKNLQDALPVVYSLAKTYGKRAVESTENDLDDAAVNEVIQVCEEAAAKYSLTLDATKL